MPYVNSDGTKLFWTERGSGPPILLIMGLSYSHDMWFRVVPALARTHRILLFDNRGMGKSDVPRGGPYTIRQMARDAAAVLDAAGCESADVVGASMGGMIAQELALREPRRVRRLLLACTSHGGLLSRWPRFTRPHGSLRWSEGERRERERALVPLLYAPSTPLARIEEDLNVQCGCNWSYRGFLSQFGGILLWSSYRRLPSLRVPTLVVHGDKDRLIPPENGRVLASRIAGAQLRLIENAGHILMTDQPEACERLIDEFLCVPA